MRDVNNEEFRELRKTTTLTRKTPAPLPPAPEPVPEPGPSNREVMAALKVLSDAMDRIKIGDARRHEARVPIVLAFV